MDECNGIAKPFKKLKVSPINLYKAAKDCNIHKVLALLVGGCDPNQQVVKAKGKTAMHAAAGGGYVDIMACLRLAGCDLSLVDYENRTPFLDAVSNHKVQAVEYLIECGANVRVRDSKGMTCFHLAVRQPPAPRAATQQCTRRRNVIWFNPPYNKNVETNILGKEFFKLIDKCSSLAQALARWTQQNHPEKSRAARLR